MRVIKKTISLEQFKSRLPILIDSFDNNGRLIHFDVSTEEKKQKTLSCYPMGNYGMTPCDLIIPQQYVGVADKSIFKSVSGASNISISNYGDVYYGGEKCISGNFLFYVLPYGTLRNLYYFFLMYNSLLRNESDCEKLISSATQYWENMVLDFSQRDKYVEMDRLFKKYGGYVNVNNGIVSYEGLDKFIVDEVYKSFKIPNEYITNWGTDKLYYIDALKWYYWFKYRHDVLGYRDDTDCNEKDIDVCNNEVSFKLDCCDCMEYKKRGGDTMYNLLSDFVKDLPYNITCPPSTTIDSHIPIVNSIDDIGEFTIFSTDWIGGVDYSPTVECSNTLPTECGGSVDVSGGTVVTYNNDVWLKTCDGKGYDILPCGMFNFNENQWVRYLESHINDDEVSKSPYKYYAYDSNDIIHIFKSFGDAASNSSFEMSEKYLLKTFPLGFIVISNEIYQIYTCQYVIHKNVVLLVCVENGKKYVKYNGKRFKVFNNSGSDFVNITKIPTVTDGENKSIQFGYCINYNGKIIISEDMGNTFVINNITYERLSSYFTYDGNNFYIKDDTIFYQNGNEFVEDTETFGSKLTSSAYDKNGYIVRNGFVNIVKPYDIHKFGYVSGNSVSRLDGLINPNKPCDDIGNTLKGYFEINENSAFAQPKEDSTLDLFYQYGNVARISQISDDAYWGDFLEDIIFYAENDAHQVLTEKQSARANNGNLSAIKKVWEEYEEKTHAEDFGYNVLRCEFIYYLGAILGKDSEGNYKLYSKSLLSTHGVKYTDKCMLNKVSSSYFLTQNISYNVYYYEITHEMMRTKYDDITVDLPKTTFEVYLNTSNMPEIEGIISFANSNALTYSPIFKEEYKFGSSSLENIKEDIYIERQIIKPLEKNLRLLDIMTLESMEEYGNGALKIIKN